MREYGACQQNCNVHCSVNRRIDLSILYVQRAKEREIRGFSLFKQRTSSSSFFVTLQPFVFNELFIGWRVPESLTFVHVGYPPPPPHTIVHAHMFAYILPMTHTHTYTHSVQRSSENEWPFDKLPSIPRNLLKCLFFQLERRRKRKKI